MRLRPSALWRSRAFLALWAGQTISLVGSEVTTLALPLTAILVLKASAFQMGVLRAVQYLPALLFGLFAGVYVDRTRRRPLLIAADLGRAVLLGAIPLMAVLGTLSMGYLYGTAFLVGTLTVVFEIAYLAFIPALVGRSELLDANGKLEASRLFAQIAGPGLGGILVQVLTAPLAMLADACSFLVSVLSLAVIRVHEPRLVAQAPGKQHLWREIGEGLRVTFSHPLLRSVLMSSGLCNFFAAILNSLAVLYATTQLDLSPAFIGGMFVVGSVGGLLGAIVAGRVTARLGVGPATLLGLSLTATGVAVWPLAGLAGSATVPILTGGIAVGAAGDAFYNINVVSMRQSVTPDRLQGRVSASGRFVIWGAQPFGAIVGGALGQSFGLRAALGVAAGGFAFAFVVLLLSPLRRVREQPAPHDHNVDPVASTVRS